MQQTKQTLFALVMPCVEPNRTLSADFEVVAKSGEDTAFAAAPGPSDCDRQWRRGMPVSQKAANLLRKVICVSACVDIARAQGAIGGQQFCDAESHLGRRRQCAECRQKSQERADPKNKGCAWRAACNSRLTPCSAAVSAAKESRTVATYEDRFSIIRD